VRGDAGKLHWILTLSSLPRTLPPSYPISPTPAIFSFLDGWCQAKAAKVIAKTLGGCKPFGCVAGLE